METMTTTLQRGLAGFFAGITMQPVALPENIRVLCVDLKDKIEKAIACTNDVLFAQKYCKHFQSGFDVSFYVSDICAPYVTIYANVDDYRHAKHLLRYIRQAGYPAPRITHMQNEKYILYRYDGAGEYREQGVELQIRLRDDVIGAHCQYVKVGERVVPKFELRCGDVAKEATSESA